MIRAFAVFLLVLIAGVFPAQAARLGPHGGGPPITNGCGPDAAPAPAAAHGLNCEVMDANFSLPGGANAIDPANGNTLIDSSNTLGTKFDFFINNAFPGQCILYGGACGTPTESNAWSISGGNLVIAPVSGDAAQNLWSFNTAAYSGTENVWKGRAFSGSYYVDVHLTLCTVSGEVGGNEPIVWMFPAEAMTRGTTDYPLDYQVELDTIECASPTRNIHQWHYDSGSAGEIVNGGQAMVTSSGFIAGNTYGLLLIQPSDNGGLGLIQPYVNEVYDNSLMTPPQMVTSPTMQPDPNPGIAGGSYNYVFAEHEAVLLNSNIGSVISVAWIRVYCASPTSC